MDLGQLKLKYQSVLNLIAAKGVRLQNLHLEGGKLFIRGAAGTEDIKNDVWNQIKLVDANWASDLVCDISIDPSLAPPQKTSAATESCSAPACRSPRTSKATRSAAIPGASAPMSSRPRTAAPPRVASASASRALSAPGMQAGSSLGENALRRQR